MVALAWAAFILVILLALTGWRMGRALALGAVILAVLGLGVWGLIAWTQAKQDREQAAQAAVCANLAAHPHNALTDQEILCPTDAADIAADAANAAAEASNAAAGDASATINSDPNPGVPRQALHDAQPTDEATDANTDELKNAYLAAHNTSP